MLLWRIELGQHRGLGGLEGSCGAEVGEHRVAGVKEGSCGDRNGFIVVATTLPSQLFGQNEQDITMCVCLTSTHGCWEEEVFVIPPLILLSQLHGLLTQTSRAITKKRAYPLWAHIEPKLFYKLKHHLFPLFILPVTVNAFYSFQTNLKAQRFSITSTGKKQNSSKVTHRARGVEALQVARIGHKYERINS